MTAPATVSGVAYGNLPLDKTGKAPKADTPQVRRPAESNAYLQTGLTEGEHDHNSIKRLSISFTAHQGRPRLRVYWCDLGVYSWFIANFNRA